MNRLRSFSALAYLGGHALAAKVFPRHRAPLAVHYLLTYRCPWKCSYCNTKLQAGEKGELGPTQALRALDELAEAGCRKVQFTGGEPMLRRELGALITRAREHGMFVGLSTSGYQVAARLEELKELDLVQLSLDGSADVHERQRGKGSYAVALGALEALDAAGIPCWTTTVLTGENLSAIDDLLDVARRRKSLANFQPLHARSEDGTGYLSQGSSLLPGDAALRATLRRLLALKRSGAPIGNSIGYLEHLLAWPDYTLMYQAQSTLPCLAGRLYAYLDADGRLYPCGSLLDTVEGTDLLALGGRRAFSALPTIPCQSCLSACQTEQNLLFGLHPATGFNWLLGVFGRGRWPKRGKRSR